MLPLDLLCLGDLLVVFGSLFAQALQGSSDLRNISNRLLGGPLSHLDDFDFHLLFVLVDCACVAQLLGRFLQERRYILSDGDLVVPFDGRGVSERFAELFINPAPVPSVGFR